MIQGCAKIVTKKIVGDLLLTKWIIFGPFHTNFPSIANKHYTVIVQNSMLI